MVPHMDVAGFARNLGRFRQLDGRAVVLKDRVGAGLVETIGIEEVTEVGEAAPTTGEAHIFSLHAGKGDAGVLSRGGT